MQHLFFSSSRKVVFGLLLSIIFSGSVFAQSGASRRPANANTGSVLNVVALREKAGETLTAKNFVLYENSIEQEIKSFTLDGSPSRIVLLADNSLSVRADVEKLQSFTKEFAYEIFEGDQIFVAAYDEKPEIIQEWTDDAKKVETSLATFRKKGNPYLFDSIGSILDEVLIPLMPATRKTAIVLISDGLDRGSKTKFDNILAELQIAGVTVYAMQIPDRTGGAFRRDAPKPEKVLEKLTESTGGKLFDMSENEPQAVAKFICDEMRKNRYLLTYQPTNSSTYDARRIFLTADEGISVRTKTAQPPSVK